LTTRNFSPAEQRAAAENAALARLDAGREQLEEIKTRHLVEAEALALARMRIQTERSLANQAEALRDAERKAETAAIERRSADLDASKEAQRRSVLETEACKAVKRRAGRRRNRPNRWRSRNGWHWPQSRPPSTPAARRCGRCALR
jgi:hypothetical protein